MESLEPITSVVKVSPRGRLINTIDTFDELDKYITVLTSILDFIEQYEGHPFFTYNAYNTKYKIVKKYEVDGYRLTLLQDGIELAIVGYYHLGLADTSWVNVGSTGINIYCFPQSNQSAYSFYSETGHCEENVEYNIQDYNEDMYEQLEFAYSKVQVNCAMCIAKLSKSDPNREYRQFVFYEYSTIDFYTILQDLKDYIFHRSIDTRWI